MPEIIPLRSPLHTAMLVQARRIVAAPAAADAPQTRLLAWAALKAARGQVVIQHRLRAPRATPIETVAPRAAPAPFRNHAEEIASVLADRHAPWVELRGTVS